MKVKGGGTKERRVEVLKNGQWKFLKSGSKKGSKKSPSKKSGSKKEPNSPGGHKVSKVSRLSPVTKNGIRVCTLGTEAGIFMAAVERPAGSDSPYTNAGQGEWDKVPIGVAENLKDGWAGTLIKWSAGAAIVAKLFDVRNVGILYFN